MEKNKIKEFEALKRKIKEYQLKISETKGKLNVIRKEAKDKFGTTDIDELKELKKKFEKRAKTIREKIDTLTEQLTNKLRLIEDMEIEND